MDKDLLNAIVQLEKKHGKGVIMDLDDPKSVKGVEFVSTGVFPLDEILGGGLPKGRMIELYGMESSGKTTLSIHIAKTFQSLGKRVAYIDVENAFDPDYARKLGLETDPDKFIFSQPDWGEQALDIIDALVKANIDLIVVDSVANLVPKCELEGESGDAVVGKVARLMSQAVRRLSGPVSEHGTVLLFINQLRQKIGVTWGDPNVTPGGMALKFGASVRIALSKSQLKDGENVTGITVTAKTVKNKVASPFQKCIFEIMFGEGVSIATDMLDIAVKKNIVELQGARTFVYNGKTIGTSKKGALEELRKNKTLSDEILEKIKEVNK